MKHIIDENVHKQVSEYIYYTFGIISETFLLCYFLSIIYIYLFIPLLSIINKTLYGTKENLILD